MSKEKINEYIKLTGTSIFIGANFYIYSKFHDGTLPILAQSFSCSGTENNLLSCGGTIGYSACYGSTAGVRCFSEYNNVFG